MKYISLILAGWLFLATACEKSVTVPSAKEEGKMLNISYGTDPRNKMDVYLPKDRGVETPFVVLIHGGGWTSSSKEGMRGFQELLLAKGYGSVSMNYRYVSATTHCAELMEDVNKVVSHCAAKSSEWNIREKKYIIGGVSAGGHMSLLYGYKYDTNERISGIISLAGPTDFTDPTMLDYAAIIGLGPSVNALAGATYIPRQSVDDRFTAISPLKQIKNIPTLLIHGTADEVVPYSQAQKLKEQLTQLNYTHKLVTLTGAGHDLGFNIPANVILVDAEFRAWIETYSR